MNPTDYVKQEFQIECKGRDKSGKEVLPHPVLIYLQIYQSPGSNTISSDTSHCIYNTGAHGQRCRASHPDVDKIGEGVECPYSFDIPHALEKQVTEVKKKSKPYIELKWGHNISF